MFEAPEPRSEEHTSELQSRRDLVCRLLLEKKNRIMQRREIRNSMRPFPGFMRTKRILTAVFIVALVPVALAQDFKVTLLGTGNPRPVISRFGPSILVEAGKQMPVFDCGRSATQRLH